jgi:hypothetical protein
VVPAGIEDGCLYGGPVTHGIPARTGTPPRMGGAIVHCCYAEQGAPLQRREKNLPLGN